MLKFGIVTELDAATGRAKIKYTDSDDMVSPWLFIGVRNTKDNKEENWVDENEHVAALLTDDMRTGIIIYSVYDKNNAPEEGDPDTWLKKFKDGMTIKYDRANHKLTVEGNSDLEIEATVKKLTVTAQDGVEVDGDLSVSGNLDVSGNIDAGGNISSDGNVNAQGNVAAQADVTAGGGVISLIGHKHLVTSAPGTTGPSIP